MWSINCSKIVLIMAFFLIFGKNSILFLFIKKVTNRSLMIIDLFLFYQFEVNFLKKLLFNSIFKFLDDNNLLNSNHSGFRPSDSCEYQLLSIIHEIYASFDCYPSLEVRGVFLDISKAFD